MKTMTATQRNALATLYSGKSAHVGFETAGALHAHGMISEVPSFGDVVTLGPELLTLSGRIEGENRWAYLNRAKLAKAARAKVHAQACRELGMKRTPTGWE
jgi:hypothetical protein